MVVDFNTPLCFILYSLPWMDILVPFSQGHWQRSPACLLFSATRDKSPLFVPSVCIITPQFRHCCSIHCPNKLASSLPNSSRMRLPPPRLANYWSGHGEAVAFTKSFNVAHWNNYSGQFWHLFQLVICIVLLFHRDERFVLLYFLVNIEVNLVELVVSFYTIY